MVDVTKKPKRGPASPYSPKLRKQVLELVADGASLTDACDRLGLPRRTARSWLERDPGFERGYELARHERVDSLFEKFVARTLAATEVVAAAERDGLNPTAQATALRTELDQLRWALSKLLPSRFGDRQQVEMTGKDGEALIPEQPERWKVALALLAIIGEAKTPEELAAEPAKPKPLPATVLTDHAADQNGFFGLQPAPAQPAESPPEREAGELRVFDPHSGLVIRYAPRK